MLTVRWGVAKVAEIAPLRASKLVTVELAGSTRLTTFRPDAAVVDPKVFMSRAKAWLAVQTTQPNVTPGYRLSMMVPLATSSKSMTAALLVAALRPAAAS